MSNHNIAKLILIVILLFIFFWTESLLPFFVIVFLVGSFRKESYLNRGLVYLKSIASARYVIFEWVLAIVISIWLVIFVQKNFLGIYTFQTSSMNGTLWPGDVLLVNKMVPGARKSPDSFDGYHRIKGLGELTYNDVIVFNFPEGDTLLKKRPTESYYYLKRLYGKEQVEGKSDKITDLEFKDVQNRPRFVKRIYGLPGDSVVINKGQVYVNSKHLKYPDLSVGRFVISDTDKKQLKKQNVHPYNELSSDKKLIWEIYEKDVRDMASKGVSLTPDCLPENYPDPLVFPFNSYLLWNMDYSGPVYVPRKGDTIELSEQNIMLYLRLIDVFEENEVQIKDDKVFINNKSATHYTVKMNYYWVMGDNRHHSFDSRFWGFVPENHIIGKVERVLLSRDLQNDNAFPFVSGRYYKKVK